MDHQNSTQILTQHISLQILLQYLHLIFENHFLVLLEAYIGITYIHHVVIEKLV